MRRLARAHVQHVIVLLKTDGPKTAYWVSELLVDFASNDSPCFSPSGGVVVVDGFAARKRQCKQYHPAVQ